MRTTVTLDPDVEALIRNRMRESGKSFKEVLNGALRTALRRGWAGEPTRYRLRTYRLGYRPNLDLDRALALAAADEDAEIERKMGVSK